MSGKAQEASIKKITDKGFTKTKAQKALKDCNNNVQQALKLLENQLHQAQKAAKAEELLRQKEQERAIKEAERERRRAAGLPADSDEERELAAMENEKIRLHPCVVQYGSCKFGKYCHFKYLPGDTCVNYLLGNCYYDIKCRNRHSWEGEDLRKFVKDLQKAPVVFEDESGACYSVDPDAKGKVVIPEYCGEAYEEDDVLAQPAPLPSAYDTTEGAEPTYTEPATRGNVWEDDQRLDDTPAPAPFLEKLRVNLESKLAEKASASNSTLASGKAGPKVKVLGAAPSVSLPSAQHRFAPVAKAKHPCIYQFGSCMYGDRCAHKDQPADVCVFFLNGKCRSSADDCQYRHEREATTSAASEEALLAAFGRPAGGAGSKISALVAEKLPSLPTTPGIMPPTNAPQWASLQTLDHVPAQYQLDIQNETEEMSFYFLKEAFPHKDDLDLLQALRLGGSRENAVELLFEFDKADEETTFDAAAVERKLQDEEAMEEIVQAERTERLITLCQLFSKMEVSSIERALEAVDGDFDAAFRDLQCRAENVVRQERKARWNLHEEAPAGPKGWAAMPTFSAADKLKLDRLYAMFKDLPKEVVNDVFADSGAMPQAIDTLRLLTHDLNDITEDDRLEADRMRTFHAVPEAEPTNTSSSFSVRAGGAEEKAVPTHSGAFISDTNFYRHVVESADGTEDWRRLRQDAAMYNRARIQCLSLAGHAYKSLNGKAAKAFSTRARQLGLMYERTNILAMHALEVEGKGAGISILDLHGFRKDEALDVLKRRLELCVRRRVRKLRVIMGRGAHSQQGRAVLFPLVVQSMRTTEPFRSLAEISTVKEASVDLDVLV